MFAIALMNGIVIGVIYALSALGVSLVVGIVYFIMGTRGWQPWLRESVSLY